MTLPDKSEDYIHRIGRTGRADRMGLAISIVSRAKEKVWYHTCASRGENCHDTRVASPVPRGPPGAMQGGCCIWYDEPACALAIQQRIGAAFDELDPATLQYHPSTVDGGAPVAYGQTRTEASAEANKGPPPELVAASARVTQLDVDAQRAFLSNRTKLASLLA